MSNNAALPTLQPAVTGKRPAVSITPSNTRLMFYDTQKKPTDKRAEAFAAAYRYILSPEWGNK